MAQQAEVSGVKKRSAPGPPGGKGAQGRADGPKPAAGGPGAGAGRHASQHWGFVFPITVGTEAASSYRLVPVTSPREILIDPWRVTKIRKGVLGTEV